MVYRFINNAYKVFYLVWDFSKKLLWFGSCSKSSRVVVNSYVIVAFMYLVPMSFEIFTEQQRILSKIQMQMMSDSMMGPPTPDMAPNIRPF